MGKVNFSTNMKAGGSWGSKKEPEIAGEEIVSMEEFIEYIEDKCIYHKNDDIDPDAPLH